MLLIVEKKVVYEILKFGITGAYEKIIGFFKKALEVTLVKNKLEIK